MGFIDGVKDIFSGIGNAISNVMKDSKLMQTLVPILTVVIPPPFDAIAMAVITVISAAMGVEEEPDKLGWQMNQADKNPEDFESFKEYKKYLDEKYPFNQAEFNALSPEQKQTCRYLGMAGTMTELKESKGFEISPETLGMLVKAQKILNWDDNMVANFAKNISVAMNANGLSSLSPLGDAAKGTLNPDDFGKVHKSLETALNEVPEGNTKDVIDIISAMRDSDKVNC